MLQDTIDANIERFTASSEGETAQVIEVTWVKKLFSVKVLTSKTRQRVWQLGENFGLTEQGKIVMLSSHTHPLADASGLLILDENGERIVGWVIVRLETLGTYDTRRLCAVIQDGPPGK